MKVLKPVAPARPVGFTDVVECTECRTRMEIEEDDLRLKSTRPSGIGVICGGCGKFTLLPIKYQDRTNYVRLWCIAHDNMTG